MDNRLTGAGRVVQGDVYDPQTKDSVGKPLTCSDNITPRVQYFIALALPKSDPDTAAIVQEMTAAAQAAWPGGQTTQDGTVRGQDAFAWKFEDGDLRPQLEGFAGCWILKLSDGFAPKVYDQQGNYTDEPIIKRGDYVSCVITYKSNTATANPGMYLNWHAVQLIGYGQLIESGPDFSETFRGRTTALPQGASATPVSPGSPPAGMAGGAQGPPAKKAAPPPHTAILKPPPADPEILKGAHSYRELLEAGWTDATLKEHGMIR